MASVGESRSLGKTLRRQGAHSSEMQVGRPAVTVEMIAKNGYGVVERTITIFLSGGRL